MTGGAGQNYQKIFLTQRTLLFPPGAVTENWSVKQLPRLLANPAAAGPGVGPVPTVLVVAVTGSFRTNVSKSSLS